MPDLRIGHFCYNYGRIIMNIENNLLVPFKTLKAAREYVEGFSDPKKMPGWSYGLPTDMCKTGMILKKIPTSVCSDCYADKGFYTVYPAVKAAQYRRLNSIDKPRWVEAMIYVMTHAKAILKDNVFRWHDSGDIQGVEHLDKIVQIAQATPNIQYWLPTKESAWIQNYNKPIPKNLVIRLSGSFVDGKPPKYTNTSTVVSNEDDATCRAFDNGGECGECRQCWDGSVKNVSYFKH